MSFGELAHVIAAREAGPRGHQASAETDLAEPDNIILLCANCHTQADKAPDHYTIEMLREWKRLRMAELETLFGAVVFESRADASAAADRLLRQNRAVFEAYGPHTAKARGHTSEAARQWRRKVREVIIPNNRRLLAMCDKNEHLLTPGEREAVERLRQHVEDLEARHFRNEYEPAALRFPVEVEGVFSDG